MSKMANETLHLTAIPLRLIAARGRMGSDGWLPE
jgi:hypothetical protein